MEHTQGDSEETDGSDEPHLKENKGGEHNVSGAENVIVFEEGDICG